MYEYTGLTRMAWTKVPDTEYMLTVTVTKEKWIAITATYLGVASAEKSNASGDRSSSLGRIAEDAFEFLLVSEGGSYFF